MDGASRDVVILFGVLFGLIFAIRYFMFSWFFKTERDLANEMIENMEGVWRSTDQSVPVWKYLGFLNPSDYNEWKLDKTALPEYMIKKIVHRDDV